MIHIIQTGLGPIGRQLTRYISEREGLQIIEAVDIDPSMANRSLAEISGISSDVTIKKSYSKTRYFDSSVAILSTVSKIGKIVGQIRDAAERGLNIVTTCEELTYPFKIRPDEAGAIDSICRENGVTCLATGVNPGFLMDYLPSAMTSVCRNIHHISISRVQDAINRRGPFQKKIGAGMEPEEFQNIKHEIGHVGLPESTYMVAAALRWDPDSLEETIEPVIAEQKIQTEHVTIEPGKVSGLKQVVTARINENEVIRQSFIAAVGYGNSFEEIKIKGEPGFTSRIEGGINGDIATSAIVVNAIPSVLNSEPGLKTMLDIPVPSWYGNL